MTPSFLSELSLYKYRYIISYTILTLLAVGLLVLRVGDVPPGYSAAEQASAVASYQLQFNLQTNVVDLPYQALQKLTLKFFGLSEWGMRLPSIIIAGLVTLGIFLLFRRWFSENIAIMSSVLAIASTHFLMFGRSGTAVIMMALWGVWILLFATLISQQAKYRPLLKIMLIGTVGLSLYTPYMIYLLVAAGLATTVHPHLRYVLRRADKVALAIAGFLVAFLLVPLGWYTYNNPRVLHDLLGIPADLPSVVQYIQQLFTVVNSLGGIFQPSIGEFGIVPMLSIPAVALCLLGLTRAVMDFHSTRAHLVLIWLALLLPIIAFNPDKPYVLFVPLIALTAIGLNALIRLWYNLFPRNPYARIFGLIPITALLVSILYFNYMRYFIALPYSSSVVQTYNSDAQLLEKSIDDHKLHDKPVTVVSPADKVPFYKIESQTTKQLQSVDLAHTDLAAPNSLLIAESEYQQLSPEQKAALPLPTQLVVNNHKEDALRFRLYVK